MPDFDNALLSHADRGRIIPSVYQPPTFYSGAFLIDGFARGTWKITRRKADAALAITPFMPLAPPDRIALEAEGTRLLAFAAADTPNQTVEWAPLT